MDNDLTIKNMFPIPGLYGLVVCGGNSRRMGTDKSMLVYHTKPQRYHLYEMLEPFCEQVFISCNTEQEKDLLNGYNAMTDLPAYYNIGPMASLLTASIHHPGKNFLLIGCDYPFLTTGDLLLFLQKCKEENTVAFYNEKDELFEPLLAYYHHNTINRLVEMYLTGNYSLQQYLRTIHAVKFYPENKKTIIGINTKEDLMEAIASINQKQV